MKKLNPLTANKFRPAVYDQKNLINFKRPLVWMTGIEKHGNPVNGLGFKVFTAFCIASALYFIFR